MELLRDLIAHRLLALNAVRLFERRGVIPLMFLDGTSNNGTGIVDQTVDQEESGSADCTLDTCDRRSGFWYDNICFYACTGCVSGPGPARITIRRHRQHAHPQFFGPRN